MTEGKVRGWYVFGLAVVLVMFFASRADAQSWNTFWDKTDSVWIGQPTVGDFTGDLVGLGQYVEGVVTTRYVDGSARTAAKCEVRGPVEGTSVYVVEVYCDLFVVSTGDWRGLDNAGGLGESGSEGTKRTSRFECSKADPECAPPPPEQCDISDANRNVLRPIFSGGVDGTFCTETSHCKAQLVHAYGDGESALGVYTILPENCGAELPEKDSIDGPACITTSGGDRFCSDGKLADQNCGYLNDQYLCLGPAMQGSCVYMSDGGMACASSAGAPPAPDDGVTPGVVAAADGELTVTQPDGLGGTSSTTINIYNPGTVAGSTGPTSGETGDANGDGVPDQQEEGGGRATASGNCAAPPTCEGDAVMCALVLQEWHTGCQELPSGSELLGLTGLEGETIDKIEGDGGDVSEMLDDGGWLGASARTCDIDFVLDLGGLFGTYTIPFSQWCNFFAFVGELVMLSAIIASMKIIGGAFV